MVPDRLLEWLHTNPQQAQIGYQAARQNQEIQQYWVGNTRDEGMEL